jgi:hypothetical protein
MSLRAIKPVIMKFRYGTISQAYDILPFLPLVIMNLCLCNFRIDIIELPPFLPNEYLFENHKQKLMKTQEENMVLQSFVNE